jgi:hypothetical protein
MSAVYANLAAWTAAAFEGSRLRATLAPVDDSGNWGVGPTFGAGGEFTISSEADGTAYLDITFEYINTKWPPI